MERTTTPLIFLKGANLVIHEERVNFMRQPTLMPRRMQIKLAILQKNKGSRARSYSVFESFEDNAAQE